MTTYLVIDTCVWLSIAAKPKLWTTLDHLEAVLEKQAARLVVPGIVADELDAGLDRIPSKTRASILGQAKQLKRVGEFVEDQSVVDSLRAAIDQFVKHISSDDGVVPSVASRIRSLCSREEVIAVDTESREIRAAACERALTARAPFHNSKNNMADALIVEACRALPAYGECRLLFVTENKTDFADPKDFRNLHPDLCDDLRKLRPVYYDNLAMAIGAIDPAEADPDLEEDYEAALRENPKCTECGGDTFGHWSRSRYGGLSWHFTCAKCGKSLDTGEFFD